MLEEKHNLMNILCQPFIRFHHNISFLSNHQIIELPFHTGHFQGICTYIFYSRNKNHNIKLYIMHTEYMVYACIVKFQSCVCVSQL